jgi:hypothetical protein
LSDCLYLSTLTINVFRVKHGCDPIERRRRQPWAALLKKVWDIDALKCPQCGGQMNVVSFIEQPSIIRRILKHLDLWKDARPPPEPLEVACEPEAEYIPLQDDVPEIEVG